MRYPEDDTDGNAPQLTPEGRQNVAAMNARTYAMSDEDRERWFAEHPVSDFADPCEGQHR
jgi:hypothetical protein